MLYGQFDYKVWEDVEGNIAEKSNVKNDKESGNNTGEKVQVAFGERCGLGWTIGEEVLFAG